MLKIIVPGDELWNEETETFEPRVNDVELELEHSLVSLSKWESKHQIPFLSKQDKTPREILDYFEAMIISPLFDSDVLARLSKENISAIHEYIESKESATTFGDMPERSGRGEVITSELIYYWMVAFNIPFECEWWHLNRLFALIRICNIKNAPAKKMSHGEMARRNRELNEKRKAQYKTSG